MVSYEPGQSLIVQYAPINILVIFMRVMRKKHDEQVSKGAHLFNRRADDIRPLLKKLIPKGGIFSPFLCDMKIQPIS